jgi:hypothetical protein
MASEREDRAAHQGAPDPSGGHRQLPVNRRRLLGVLGAFAAAAAGAVALSAGRPEEASAAGYPTFTSNDPTATVETDNTGFGSGLLGTTTAGGGTTAGVKGISFGVGGNGVYGVADISSTGNTAFGVFGTSASGVGTVGYSYNGSNAAVLGQHNAGGTGVLGTTNSSSAGAVTGQNGAFGPAVFGNNIGTGNGVYGLTSTPAGGQAAVLGVNSGTGGPGVEGFSPSGTGVGGGTASGIGFGGVATTTGAGVVGQAHNGPAIQGVIDQGGTGLAGDFRGSVSVSGILTVMGSKSAAVRGSSGNLVRLYCVESPESWFEDFGSGRLSNGSATVQLEPGFASVVKTEGYHVFLTPDGETEMLHVRDKTPSGFVVQESHGGTSNVSFSYRVIAKRKDIAGARLEHVDELPPPPALPKSLSTPPTNIPQVPTLPDKTVPGAPAGQGQGH